MLPMKKSSHESALRVKQHFLRVLIKRLLFVSSVVNDVDIPRLPEFFRADGGNVPRDGGEDGIPPQSAQPGRIPGLGRRRNAVAAHLRRQQFFPAATLPGDHPPGTSVPFLLYTSYCTLSRSLHSIL